MNFLERFFESLPKLFSTKLGHTCDYQKPYLEHGYFWRKCSHEGCRVVDHIDEGFTEADVAYIIEMPFWELIGIDIKKAIESPEAFSAMDRDLYRRRTEWCKETRNFRGAEGQEKLSAFINAPKWIEELGWSLFKLDL